MTNKSSILSQLGRLTGDDYSSTPVPRSERLNTIIPLIAWTGFAMFMPTYIVGAQVGIGAGSFSRALLMIIVGTLFLACYVSLHGIIGIKTGYSFGMLSSFAFGRKLAFIPAFNFGDAGWAIVIIGLFSWDIGPALGIDPRVLALGIGVLMLTATYVGLKGAFWVNMVQFIIMVCVGVAGVTIALKGYGQGFSALFQKDYAETFTYAAGITSVVGLFANGTSRGADLIRWCKGPRGAWAVGLFAFGIGAMFCSLSGAIIAACTGNTDIYSCLVMLGIPVGAVAIYFCLSWTTVDMSGYASSLGISCIPKLLFDKDVPRRKVALIVSIVIVALSALGLHNYLTNWLTLMGTLLPALGGVIFADYYIMSKTKYHWICKDAYTKYKVEDAAVKDFNWSSLPALIIGGWFGMWSSNHGFLIPSFNSIIVTMLLYCGTCFIVGAIRLKKDPAPAISSEAK